MAGGKLRRQVFTAISSLVPSVTCRPSRENRYAIFSLPRIRTASVTPEVDAHHVAQLAFSLTCVKLRLLPFLTTLRDGKPADLSRGCTLVLGAPRERPIGETVRFA
jgi:hypothetical protein